jgi:glycosyltransferase involved in cell wall biosynthesis
VHLTALVESPKHVCCRYRLTAFRPYLEQAGHRLELRAVPPSWWSRLGLFRSLRHTDAVVLQRKLLQPWQLFFLRRAAPLLIYDFDDSVFLRDSYAAKGLHSRGRLRRFRATVRAADAVAAGNSFLRQHAAEQGTKPVHVVPTCVDTGKYPRARHERTSAGTQLVWLGSSSTLRGLEVAAPLLEEIGRRCPGVCLKLICDRFFSLQHLPVRPCPWTEASEAAELAAADIGISWLPDDDWSRGKCGLKVLQYMAAGLPVVANPVGVQREMVRHGETGFLVETPEQWSETITRLAREPHLRQTLGRAGRRRVETDYSVAAGAMRWLALLRQLPRREAA